MKPLYSLSSGSGKITWSAELEEIRLKVVTILTNEPALVIFDPQYPIELHTDASACGYGAILLHRIESKPHVIEYFSKTTTSVESRYHSYELETLAVVKAVKHFRHYLIGREFVVYTDCNSLKASRTKIDLTPEFTAGGPTYNRLISKFSIERVSVWLMWISYQEILYHPNTFCQ